MAKKITRAKLNKMKINPRTKGINNNRRIRNWLHLRVDWNFYALKKKKI